MDILFVFTGGTIGSGIRDGYICVDKENINKIISKSSISGKNINLHIANPYTILSETLNGTHIAKLVSCLNDNIASYDGIIIAHGTDTLQYTAAALGFAFSDTTIPIILVSSNYVLDDSRSNGLDNLNYALEYIYSGGKPGVYVSYKNTGHNSRMYNALALLSHPSYDDSLYELKAYSGTDLPDCTHMNQACLRLQETSPVLWLRAYPGMHFPSLTPDSSAYRYILLESYHSGTLDTSSNELKLFSNTARRLGIKLFLTGLDSDITYETTKLYSKLGIDVLTRMSPISAYMKLWLLSYTSEPLS